MVKLLNPNYLGDRKFGGIALFKLDKTEFHLMDSWSQVCLNGVSTWLQGIRQNGLIFNKLAVQTE